MSGRRALWVIATVMAVAGSPAAGLDITLSAGVGTAVTIVDDGVGDANLDPGTIDFNLTVEGIFAAQGRVAQEVGPISRSLLLTATPPSPEGTFRNVGGASANFTVTINSSPFPVAGPPLGFNVLYVGSADDPTPDAVSIPSHSVTANINGGAETLTTIVGTAITVVDDIDHAATGVNQTAAATSSQVVFAFSPGPGDRIRLPDNMLTDGGIELKVFDHDAKCIDKMNNGTRKVADAAQKGDAKCTKAAGNVTACVDDPAESRTQRKESKLLADFGQFCDPVPAWGVNGASCCEGGANEGLECPSVVATCPGGACISGACISGATEAAANALTHDVFGAAVVTSSDRRARTCQRKVLLAVGKLFTERWRVFRRCKKQSFDVIANDPTLVSTCLGPPQPDPQSKLAKRQGQVSTAVLKKCIQRGVTPVGTFLPGVCAPAADPMFAACVNTRAACRFCLAVNVSDDIDPPVACDLFDDGSGNGSCP